ncbi:MAG TPA: formylglycine-generating enzyme family protein [Candidatus Binatia bacterium]|nr:formylglycine-generating enzyme family protein [Candidatus Binatia bacterium]
MKQHAASLLALAWLALPLPAQAAPDAMRTVPAGVARIGSDQGRADERPAFTIPVDAFELDRTPVTVAAFAGFVAQRGYRTQAERLGSGAVMTFGTGRWQLVPGADWRRPLGPSGAPAPRDHPVTQVSWDDAQAYCAAQGKRLPTEIEYEYAARRGAPEIGAHAFGAALAQGGRYRANVWTGVFPVINTADDGYRATSPVGAFAPDALGLHDMAGNVWEWTEDWYRPYPQRNEAWPAGRSGEKVQRGGSFLCDPKFCYGFRLTSRGHAAPDSAHMHVGFRCARSLAPPLARASDQPN